jgi:hypothetical protein
MATYAIGDVQAWHCSITSTSTRGVTGFGSPAIW